MTVTNVTPPVISGTTVQGNALHSTPGTWTSDDPLTYDYQWERCDGAGANCSDIQAATASSYILASADVGHTLRCRVTATEHATPPPGSDALSWSPPSITEGAWNPKTVHLTNASSGSVVKGGGDPPDLLLICDEALTNKEIVIQGWRHVEAIGGKITWTVARDNNERRGMSLCGNTGIVHIEGWEITATNAGMTDGMVTKNGGSLSQIIQIQNCRIGPNINNGSYHADAFQCQVGPIVGEVRFDYCTLVNDEALIGGFGNSHGIFLKNETQYDPNSHIGKGTIRRVNSRGAQHAYWQQTSDIPIDYGLTPTSKDVFITNSQQAFGQSVFPQSDGYGTLPRKAVLSADGTYLWFVSTNITGLIAQGLPPGGDYVPAGSVGVGYVSPGYV